MFSVLFKNKPRAYTDMGDYCLLSKGNGFDYSMRKWPCTSGMLKFPLFLLPSPGWDIGSIILKTLSHRCSHFSCSQLLWGTKGTSLVCK